MVLVPILSKIPYRLRSPHKFEKYLVLTTGEIKGVLEAIRVQRSLRKVRVSLRDALKNPGEELRDPTEKDVMGDYS